MLAALAMLGACKRASPESPPEPAAGTASALPVPAAAAPTAVASEAPCGPPCGEWPQPAKDDSGCPVMVDHPGNAGEILGSWKEILTRLQAVAPGGESPWNKMKSSASEAEIRRALTGKPDGAASVWLIPSLSSSGEPSVWHVAGKRSDGKLALFLAISGEREYGVCPGEFSAALETRGMPRLIVEQELQQPVPAGERYVCSVGSYARTTIFLDINRADVPLTIEEKISAENNAKPVWVEIVQQKDKVKVKGAGCNLEEPLRP